MEINAKCACGKKCEGVCKKANLLRPRKRLKICPSAYGEEVNEYLRAEK